MKILKYPHPVLAYECKPLLKINQELRNIVDEMFETMYTAAGVGLAANQVGMPFQLFVMNATGSKEEKEEEYVIINPVIIKKSGNVIDNEGCLSFPDIHADVVRPEMIEFESISLSGEVQYFKWKNRPARIVQHEWDHLNGMCFVDRLTATAKIGIRSELDDMQAIFEGDLERYSDDIESSLRLFNEYKKKFC